MPIVVGDDFPAGAPDDALAAFQQWQAGNQAQAIGLIAARAEKDEPWAIGFLPWLYMQQGVSGFRTAIPHAVRARNLGMPWVAVNLFNNIMGNIPNAPDLLEPAVKLLEDAVIPAAPAVDPIGQGWNLLANGQAAAAVRVMGTRLLPATPAGMQEVLEIVRAQTDELDRIAGEARSKRASVAETAAETLEAFQSQLQDLETKTRQAGLLITSVNSVAANALYEAEAERNAEESKFSWRAGIAVLSAAAIVAVRPLVLHYLGQGPEYTGTGLLLAHTGSTAALGAVAGVLLARARGRDHARQRARDLSTAMGTMISYSNQIEDSAEKQRFMLTMGQLVLQAHLQGDGGPKEESLVGLAALLNVMRQPTTGTN